MRLNPGMLTRNRQRANAVRPYRRNEMKEFLKWFGVGLVILAITVSVLLVVNQILPEGWTLTSEILLGLAAIVLSLTFTYLPGLRVKFATLTDTNKALVNLISVTVLAVVMFLGMCIDLFDIPGITCTNEGLRTLVIYLVIAIGGNQLAYVPSVKPSDVIDAKSERSG